MRYQRFAALVLAAALLLAGCGGTQSSPSAAADQSSDSSRSTPSAAVQTAQKERITDQWSLEKTVRGEMIGVMKLSIHVPQFVCDSPDAAALNEELAAMYVAEYKDYESYPDAEVPQGEESPQTEIINWDAYWYGDCVSLVIRRRDYDDAPWYYSCLLYTSREEDEHPVLLIQPAVFHGQAHAVQRIPYRVFASVDRLWNRGS